MMLIFLFIEQNNTTPLHHASENGFVQVVSILLEHKANVSAEGDLGFTPLHGAALRGHVEVGSYNHKEYTSMYNIQLSKMITIVYTVYCYDRSCHCFLRRGLVQWLISEIR